MQVPVFPSVFNSISCNPSYESITSCSDFYTVENADDIVLTVYLVSNYLNLDGLRWDHAWGGGDAVAGCD